MSVLRGLAAVMRRGRTRVTRELLALRIQFRNPTLACDPTAVWDYGWADVDDIVLGMGVMVCAHAEIIMYRRSPLSSVPGRLILEDRVLVSTGANIRAAGGTIRMGAHSCIAQHTVLVAANHSVERGLLYLRAHWDEQRTGIDIGRNVWVGANCVVLPGVTIGDNSVVAAGSVVTRNVPPNEIWAGVPARRLKAVPEAAASLARDERLARA